MKARALTVVVYSELLCLLLVIQSTNQEGFVFHVSGSSEGLAL
ncbi:hypothetical protein OM416_27125 [Paenibacillus sp. LS1]|nr:hypothetical protein [Paenibacillus sp. LS1]MCW3795283.1 hypothetical protein [Paenibacillus sp. LS1]